MPKRPDTLETVRIVLELLKRVPRRRWVSATELHAQLSEAGFSRDLRTTQRLLDTICQHFEIERSDTSKPYRYRWKERAAGFSLPGLNRQESLLLALAERQLSMLLPPSLSRSMSPFFQQARGHIKEGSDSRLERQWLEKVRVVSQTQPLLPPTVNPAVLEAVSEALFSNTWLALTYKNAGGLAIKADVMPLGLAQQGVRLYLICRFRNYNDNRTLALNRITSAQQSTLTFDRPSDFDLKRFEDEGQFGFGDGRQVQLSFQISKQAGRHLAETPLSADQYIETMPNSLRVTATVVDSKQLDWWLQSFGPNAWDIRKKPSRSAPASALSKAKSIAQKKTPPI